MMQHKLATAIKAMTSMGIRTYAGALYLMRPSMRKSIIAPALALALQAFISTPVSADTWVLAAAACPPWKDIPGKPELSARMESACETDVALFVDGFRATYNIADDHVTTLVNAEATTQNVTDAIAELAKNAAPDDRVFVYVNTHGGQVEAMYQGYEVEDEIFAWYTEEKPADFTKATEDGSWMSVRAFRDAVNAIIAHEIIVVIEACDASVSMGDFVDNVSDGVGGRGDNWPGREAIIFSAHAQQIANFTADGSAALFTQTWSNMLQNGRDDTLFDSFEAARLATHRTVRANCAEGETHAELLKDWKDYKVLCTQMPTSWDPFGLLDDMALPGQTFGDKT